MLIGGLERCKGVRYRQRRRRQSVHRGGATNEMSRESPFSVLQEIQICLGNTQARRRLPFCPAFGEPSSAQLMGFHTFLDNTLVIRNQHRRTSLDKSIFFNKLGSLLTSSPYQGDSNLKPYSQWGFKNRNPIEVGAEIFAAELVYREKDFRFDLRRMRVRPSDAH